MLHSINEVKIPEDFFQILLESYYFKKSCEHFRVELWNRYEDVLKYANQLAIEDIDESNKE